MDRSRSEDTLSGLLNSEEWVNYFETLSQALGITLEIYSGEGERLQSMHENPYCTFLRSPGTGTLQCPDSCSTLLHALSESDAPFTAKCKAGITHFVVPVFRFNERAYLIGNAGFSSYEDLLGFLALSRENNLGSVLAADPLNFCSRENLEITSRYVQLSVERQLSSMEVHYKAEEKMLRLMSLFDSKAFATLSKRKELLYRYILDSIEFVFGKTSSALLAGDRETSFYRTACSTGRHEAILDTMSISSDSPLITEMFNSRLSLTVEDMSLLGVQGETGGIKSCRMFPVFHGNDIDIIIGLCDRDLSRDDSKIMNALCDFVQLNLENNSLRMSAGENKKEMERLSSFSDFSQAIAPVLDTNELFTVLLDKSLKLLNAEQGSLMLLDNETSELVVEATKSADEVVQEKMKIKSGEGIAGKVVEHGESILVTDIETDARIRQQNRPRFKTKSFISALIKVNGRITGVLNAADKLEGGVFSEDDLKLIHVFLGNAAIAIERGLLFQQTETLRKLSITDPLTGSYNRRYLNHRLEEEITRYNRYKHPFSFLMYDLDGFKQYNDTFGHLAGDNLLRSLAGIINSSLRNIDIAARFGGDEFVSIFPQTPKVDAIQITNRLKEKIDEALSQEEIAMHITISMGLATYPDDASSIMELIEKTDQALYLAKKGGGNRVVYL